MTRFRLAVGIYALLCLAVIIGIVLRGEGPNPRVLRTSPYDGDRYYPGGPATITFSTQMDDSTVERALQVSPGSQGQGVWNGNSLSFQPEGDWRPNITYTIRLVGSVTDALGRPLHTPFTFRFRVHHVNRLVFCRVHGVRNVCERQGRGYHAFTQARTPVLTAALSPDGTTIAYTRVDASGLPHLFVITVDGTFRKQLTSGTRYADSDPSWPPEDSTDMNYLRRPAIRTGNGWRLGKPQSWNINVDGTGNTPP